MFPRYFATATVSLLAITSAANAATIELANGYKLDGTVLGRDDKVLHLDTPLLGKVDVPLTNVVKVEGEEVKAPVTAPAAEVAAKTVPAPAPAPSAEKPATKEPASVFTDPDLSASIDRFLERVRFLKGWKTDLALGVGLVAGEKDSMNTTVTFNTERKWKTQEFRYELLQEYEKVDAPNNSSYVSKDRLKTNARYRHDISERFFGEAKSAYSYDTIREIDMDFSESLGAGWRVIKRSRLNVALTPALTLQKQKIRGTFKDMTYAPTLFEELTYDLTKSTSLRQEFSILFPVNGDDDNSYHFSLAMKSMLSNHLSLNFIYLFDSDGSLPSDIEPSESSVNMLLGVSF